MKIAFGSNRTRRGSASHSTRPSLRGAVHVVLRIRRNLPSLRTPRTYRALECAFRAAKEKEGFGLAEYSVQHDHLHLLVHVDDEKRLSRAMQGFAIRVAKALNRCWRGRLGSVFADRYFARAVASFTELRRVVRYILQNARKHGVWTKSEPDPFSSARWFHWQGDANTCRRRRSPPIVRGKSPELDAIARQGLAPDDLPGPRRRWIDDGEWLILST